MKESKEKIKSRMLKNASRAWGYHDTEAESSFDPLVGLIMGTLAFELEKISGDIHTSEARVVEKLIQLLTPEPIVGPLPAHGILRAQPNQPVYEIHQGFRFYLNKKLKNPADPLRFDEKSIFFTPAGNYKLFNGELKYMVTSRKLFEFQKEGYKELIAESGLPPIRESSEIWIGIKFEGECESLKGLSLYFDPRGEMHEDSFYQSLPRTVWTINGKHVQFTQGYGSQSVVASGNIGDMIQHDMNISAKVNEHANNFYRERFMTIAEPDQSRYDFSLKETLPASLRSAFDDAALKLIKSECLWMKVEFPQVMSNEVLESISCSINCFPVVNRQLNAFTYSARDEITIIPLSTEDSFHDIIRVSNSSGGTYLLKSFTQVKDIDKGSYIIRQGGVGRFDSRDARDILNYFLELLRDESAAFTILGADMVSSNLRELNQIIARLEQPLRSDHFIKDSNNYLMLKALSFDETVFVEFWSTNGSLANGIKTGTPLSVYEGSDIKQASVKLITSTMGGREKLDTENRLNAYRRALLSKDRVVTAEDVKALCAEHFGNTIDKVEVKKGVAMGAVSNSGFIRTIDVHVFLSKRKAQYSEEDLFFLKKDLYVKLEEKSMNLMPYRVFFQ